MSEQKSGWWSTVKKRFSRGEEGKPVEAKPENKVPENEIKQTPQAQLDRLENMLPSGIRDNEKIVSELVKKIKGTSRYFFLLGWENGVLGNESKEPVERLAKAYPNYIKIELETEVEGVRSALAKDVVYKKDQRSLAEEEYREEREYLNYLEVQRRYNSNSFSRPLATLYLCIGILLFLSDIPLALNLISAGFDLFMSTSETFLINKFSFRPWDVFRYNWEVFITAFGIAFITVYIKIFYDDYIGFQEGANSIRMAKMNRIWGDYDKIRSENRYKLIAKLVILCAVIGLLIVLAVFRSETMHQVDPDFHDTPLSRVVFLFITLMLPIVSGICLSISMKTFQNESRRKKAGKDVEELREKLEAAIKNLDEAEKKFEVVQALMFKWIDKNTFYEFMQDVLLSDYSLGYEQGLREPERYDGETDYMRRAEIMRNKLLARNTFKKIKEHSS